MPRLWPLDLSVHWETEVLAPALEDFPLQEKIKGRGRKEKASDNAKRV
jgi:hypothetical protein